MGIFAPVFYGILGAIIGAIAAALYNVFAGWLGGVEMEFEIAGAPQPGVQAPYPIVHN
jgi:cobalamin biosynthesis protein CobD/CbiB